MLQLILSIGVLHDAISIQTDTDAVAVVHDHRSISSAQQDANKIRRAKKMKARQAEKRRIMAEKAAEKAAQKRNFHRSELAKKKRISKAKADAARKAKLEAKRKEQKRKAALERERKRQERIEMQRRIKAAEKRAKAAQKKRQAEAERKAKAEMARKQRAAEAKQRANAELKRKRKAAEAARQAKLAEKKRLEKERQRARIQAERLERLKAEKRAAAQRLKAERFAKMQAAKELAAKEAAAERRAQRRAQQLQRERTEALVKAPVVVVQTSHADLKREKKREELRRKRQRRQGLRGWSPSNHRRNVQGSKWHPRYWGAGVFYYNADTPDVTVVENHTTIINEAPQVNETTQVVVQQQERAVDFRKSLSFGLRGGASTPDLNEGVTDAGLGGAIGYRLFEPVGVELSYIHQGDRIDISHDSPLQATGKLFLFPWSNVNPYVSGGLNIAKTQDDAFDYGAHGGLGVQFGTGKTALNLEARYSGFEGSEQSNSLSAILGVDYHF